MLLRVLSDIHSNIQALEAVLADPPGREADATVCLGDIVGYGADPSSCVDAVRDGGWLTVAGNHDSGVTGGTGLDWFNPMAAVVIRWTRDRLDPARHSFLSALPLTAVSDRFLLCHSYPPDPESFDYVTHPAQARECCRRFPGRVMLTGHTHTPMLWTCRGGMDPSGHGVLPETCVFTAGSVGQPRDGDPRAAYALLDTDTMGFRHMRVGYDTEAAAAAIRAAGLPEVFAGRLFVGR